MAERPIAYFVSGFAFNLRGARSLMNAEALLSLLDERVPNFPEVSERCDFYEKKEKKGRDDSASERGLAKFCCRYRMTLTIV